MSTKIVKNTLSEETMRARTPKGNGSNALSPGIAWRFTRLQIAIKITWASRNPTLPTSFVIVSLTRSETVRRPRASCSSLAIALMLYCVGFSATRLGNGLSMGYSWKHWPSANFGFPEAQFLNERSEARVVPQRFQIVVLCHVLRVMVSVVECLTQVLKGFIAVACNGRSTGAVIPGSCHCGFSWRLTGFLHQVKVK